MARKILMNVAEGDECRIAVLENGKLFEFFIDRPSQLKHVGNIYKAVINNIEPGIQAAFVDIGLERNGFLHVSDVNYAYQNSPDLSSLFSRTLRIKESLAEDGILESDKERDVEEVDEYVGDGTGTGAESKNGADEAEFLDKLNEEQHGHPVTDSPLAVEVPEQEPPTPEEQSEDKGKESTAEQGKEPPEERRRRRRPRRRRKHRPEEDKSGQAKADKPATADKPDEKAPPAPEPPAAEKPAEEKPKLLPGQGPRRAETEQADKARQEAAQKQAAGKEAAPTKPAQKRRRTPKKRGGKLPKRVLESENRADDKPGNEEPGGGGGPLPGSLMRFHRGPQPSIQSILKRGQEVVVQVAKASQGGKGPGLTTFVSLPGRYMVLTPNTSRGGVSRKIEDGKARGDLRKMLDKLPVPEGMGVIIRTAAINRTFDDLLRDLNYLLRVWSVIVERVHEAKSPALLYSDSDPAIRTVRDYFTADTEEIIIDDREVYERVLAFFDQLMPSFRDRVKLYEGDIPLFFESGMETQIDHIFDKRVPLKSGGYLFIEQTEALVSIDVNSGKFTSAGDAEKTAFLTNKEAIPEICRQLRLRDLAGIVCCDLIDMSTSRHRTEIEQMLRRELRKDRARTKVAKMSPFGVIEMTRQRIRPSIKNYNYVDCPTCAGFGMVRSAETMCLQLIRRMKLALVEERVTELAVQVHPHVLSHLHSEFREDIDDLEEEYDKRIVFEYARDLVLGQSRLFYVNDRGNRVLYDIDQRINSLLKGSAPKSKSNVGVPEGASGAASPAVLAAQKDERRSKRRRRGGRRQREKESERREREARIKAEGEKAVTFGDTLPAANVEVVAKEKKDDTRETNEPKRRRGRRGGRKAREREARKEAKVKSGGTKAETQPARSAKAETAKEPAKADKKPSRKTATKKTTEKKAATKKSAEKKPAVKKTPAKKAASDKKPATKKAARTPAKKPAAKKTPARKTVAKKPASKKTPAKKTAAKKPAAKKAPAKKAAAKKPAAKKAPAKKPAAKKSPAKKASTTKKSTTTKKTATKKPAAKKSPAKKK